MLILVYQIWRQAIVSAQVMFGSYSGAAMGFQDLGKEVMIMSLKSLLLIFDPKALASDHLLHMLIIKLLKSVQSE